MVSENYNLIVHLYYDNAFNVRYNNASTLIDSMYNLCSDIYWQILGLRVIKNNLTMIQSTPDKCKIARGITINSTTIDSNAMCPANPSLLSPDCDYYDYNCGLQSNCENCTAWQQVYRDFMRDYYVSSQGCYILISGSLYYNDSGVNCNRSYHKGHGIIIQKIKGNVSIYYKNACITLLHELAHEIGAPDHYHEMYLGSDGLYHCRGGNYCLRCNPSTGRPADCLMGDNPPSDLGAISYDDIFCSDCINDIINYLNTNF